MSILFAISVISTIVYNKVRYPHIVSHYDTIQTYDDIPVTNDRLLNFSAGAGYWTYYIGIGKFIQENYNLDNTDFIGTSAGSLICTALAYKIPFSTIVKYSMIHLDRCSANPMGIFGYWNISYTISIISCFNEVNIRPKRLNLYNGASKLTRFGFKKQYIDSGLSMDTLITSSAISCWIPFITAPIFQPLLSIHGTLYGDGFWTGRDNPVHKKHLIIYPNKFRRLPFYTYWLWLGRDYNTRMIDQGYEDAKQNRHVFDEFFS